MHPQSSVGPRNRLPWLVLLATVATNPATAQIPDTVQFEDRTTEPVFERDDADLPAISIAGDLDGDGLADLVYSGGDKTRVFLNRDGTFEQVFEFNPPTVHFDEYTVVVDFDGDGHADLVGKDQFVPLGRPLIGYGDGTGRIVETVRGTESASATVSGDFDMDGDLELLLLTTSRPARLVERTGRQLAPGRNASPPLPSGGYRKGGVAVDLDLDGDPDVATKDGVFLINDGTGNFTLGPVQVPSFGGGIGPTLVGDLDGDRAPDFVSSQDEVWFNDGTGSFTYRSTIATGSRPIIALADCDADGDLDVVLGEARSLSANANGHVYIANDGAGRFTGTGHPIGFDDEARPLSETTPFDADGDGDTDFAPFGSWRSERGLAIQTTGGRFVEVGEPRIPADSSAFRNGPGVVLDFDGNGFDDLITFDGRLLRNRDGRFIEHGSPLPSVSFVPNDSLTGDIDGDGDIDLVTGSRLFVNDGSGVFTDATGNITPRPGASSPFSTRAALRDVDGDGSPDLVTTGANDRGQVYLNDGAGRFRLVLYGIPLRPFATARLIVGDANGDRLPDLLADVDGSQDSELLLNGGGGFFGVSLPRIPGKWSALADVDGDGDDDLVSPDAVGLNDGNGTFTIDRSRVPPHPQDDPGLTVTDVDDDGDPDLWIYPRGSTGDRRLLLWLNDGNGRFRDVSARIDPVAAADAADVASLDVDGDGDDDAIVLGTGRLLVNHHRQLTSPSIPAPGTRIALDLYVEPAYSGLRPRVAQMFAATAPARIRIPGLEELGTLRLDPTTIIAFPPRLIPSSGIAPRVDIPIPSDPALRGLSLYLQSMVVQTDSSIRFTNVLEEVIL